MDASQLVNENIGKKMGMGMLGMYLVSQCTDQAIAYVIAAVTMFGITAQTIIDWRKISREHA